MGMSLIPVVGGVRMEDGTALARLRPDQPRGVAVLTAVFELYDTGWQLEEFRAEGDVVGVARMHGLLGGGALRRTMADMLGIATANGTFRVDQGRYASGLQELAPTYLRVLPPTDAWGHRWSYEADQEGGYTLRSFGCDGQPGPEPPARWPDSLCEPDLVLRSGQFTQAPTDPEPPEPAAGFDDPRVVTTEGVPVIVETTRYEVTAGAVPPGLLQEGGWRPWLGRFFLPEDHRPGSSPTVLLSHEFWAHLGAEPSIIGTTITVDGKPRTVLGVVEPDATPTVGRHILLPR